FYGGHGCLSVYRFENSTPKVYIVNTQSVFFCYPVLMPDWQAHKKAHMGRAGEWQWLLLGEILVLRCARPWGCQAACHGWILRCLRMRLLRWCAAFIPARMGWSAWLSYCSAMRCNPGGKPDWWRPAARRTRRGEYCPGICGSSSGRAMMCWPVCLLGRTTVGGGSGRPCHRFLTVSSVWTIWKRPASSSITLTLWPVDVLYSRMVGSSVGLPLSGRWVRLC